MDATCIADDAELEMELFSDGESQAATYLPGVGLAEETTGYIRVGYLLITDIGRLRSSHKTALIQTTPRYGPASDYLPGVNSQTVISQEACGSGVFGVTATALIYLTLNRLTDMPESQVCTGAAMQTTS